MRSVDLAAVILSAALVPARAETDHTAIAKDALSKVIRPGYDDLAAMAAALEE